MEIRDETYNIYATTVVRNVPTDKLKYLINMFLIDVARDMGTDLKDETTERVIEIVIQSYSFLPVCMIASAFMRGSMGDFGAGRLMPRTIYGWLKEASIEHQRQRDHKEIEDRLNTVGTPIDLRIYPMGKALNQKVDWLISDAITDEEWDKIDLKELAGAIGKGQESVPELFIK